MSEKPIVTYRLDGKFKILTDYVRPSKTGEWLSDGRNIDRGFWVSRRMVDADIYEHLASIVHAYHDAASAPFFRWLISTGSDVAAERHKQMVNEFDDAMMAYTFGVQP